MLVLEVIVVKVIAVEVIIVEVAVVGVMVVVKVGIHLFLQNGGAHLMLQVFIFAILTMRL